jgi:hypothetical protein
VKTFDCLRRRQNIQVTTATIKAIATAPTAIPTFAPVESDGEDEDGESVGLEPPVGQLMLSLPDTR